MDTIVKTPIESAMRSNIWKLYAVQCLTQALFLIPVIVPFYQMRGLTMQQVMWLQGAFAFTILVLEIPTGYIADRWGRKQTIIAAGFLGAIGYGIYGLSGGFWDFLLAEITIGIGASFFSGSVEAMTYDTLLTLKEERKYREVAGGMNFWEFSSEAISGLIGGGVAIVSLTLPAWLTVIPMTLATIVALTLREPARHGAHETQHWKMIWDVTKHTLFTHRALRNIILLHGAITSLTLTFFWFFQAYQKLVGMPLAFFGLTHAIAVVAGALAAKYVVMLEKRMDDRLILMSIAAIVVACFLLTGLPAMFWLVGTFVISRFAWGALSPLTSDIVNRMTESKVRATVLSLRSFVGRLIFCTAAPIIGFLADTYSIPFALFTTGTIGMLLLCLLFIRMKPVWQEIPS